MCTELNVELTEDIPAPVIFVEEVGSAVNIEGKFLRGFDEDWETGLMPSEVETSFLNQLCNHVSSIIKNTGGRTLALPSADSINCRTIKHEG